MSPSCMRWSEDNFWESSLFFHIQVAELSHECLNPLGGHTGPEATDTLVEIIVNASR